MPLPVKSSPFQLHKQRWGSCTACPLCETRSNVVLVRGSLPADVLCVGEAPGLSEDAIGRAFVGPAGHLLDAIIKEAIADKYTSPENRGWDSIRVAFTNIVCCLPLGEEGSKVAEPPKESILACAPRLRELVSIAKPRLIVCVGALAEKWVPKILSAAVKNIPVISILHPAFILRLDAAQKPLAVKRCVVAISDAVSSL